MKQFIYLLIVLFTAISCTEKETVVINLNETKTITLNTGIDLSSKVGDVFNRTPASTCTFPEEYKHSIPDLFNVTFIPTGAGKTYSFSNIKEGQHTFEVPANKYRVVVTNSKVKYPGELPVYTLNLYLYGENTIDFVTEDTGTVIVNNPYSSVMVVDNISITSPPRLDGQSMERVEGYYNIYVKKTSKAQLSINNNQKEINRLFEANKVYRYMICPESDLGIIISDDIFKHNPIDTKF